MTKEKKTKRDRILDAAYTLFIDKGYWDTKIINIADAAGIGKGTVYEYFESKGAIFLELFKTRVAAGYENLSELLSTEISCEKKIKKYIDIEIENASKYTFSKSFLLDMMMKSDAFRNPELIHSIHRLVSQKFQIMFQIIENGIRDGEFYKTDPLLATISVMGAINFFISFDYSPISPEEFLPAEKITNLNQDELLRLILNGLKL